VLIVLISIGLVMCYLGEVASVERLVLGLRGLVTWVCGDFK